MSREVTKLTPTKVVADKLRKARIQTLELDAKYYEKSAELHFATLELLNLIAAYKPGTPKYLMTNKAKEIKDLSKQERQQFAAIKNIHERLRIAKDKITGRTPSPTSLVDLPVDISKMFPTFNKVSSESLEKLRKELDVKFRYIDAARALIDQTIKVTKVAEIKGGEPQVKAAMHAARIAAVRQLQIAENQARAELQESRQTANEPTYVSLSKQMRQEYVEPLYASLEAVVETTQTKPKLPPRNNTPRQEGHSKPCTVLDKVRAFLFGSKDPNQQPSPIQAR